MKRQLMAFAAIAAFTLPALAPVSAHAQSRQERAQERANQITRDAHRAQGLTPPPETNPRRPDRPNSGRPDRPDGDINNNRPDRPNSGRPDRPDGDRNNNRPDRPNSGRPERPESGWNNNRPDRPDRPNTGRPDRPGSGWNNNRPDRPNAGRPDRPNGGWDRDRSRREYRNRFDSNRWQRDWNRNQRSDWWRSDRRFRNWSGVRIGFYFAPGYGYYNVPRQYYGQQFYEGQYLPSIFWRYQMNDYRTYGLGYPPEGTRWVYVDSTIYLIDEYDGFIIDVVRNFWRW